VNNASVEVAWVQLSIICIKVEVHGKGDASTERGSVHDVK